MLLVSKSGVPLDDQILVYNAKILSSMQQKGERERERERGGAERR